MQNLPEESVLVVDQLPVEEANEALDRRDLKVLEVVALQNLPEKLDAERLPVVRGRVLEQPVQLHGLDLARHIAVKLLIFSVVVVLL